MEKEKRGVLIKTCKNIQIRVPVEDVDSVIKNDLVSLTPYLFGKVKNILKGFDEDQEESEDGWWETSTEVDFGKKKLKEIEDLIKEFLNE